MALRTWDLLKKTTPRTLRIEGILVFHSLTRSCSCKIWVLIFSLSHQVYYLYFVFDFPVIKM